MDGRSRPLIMADMQKRIERGDIDQEKQDAIKVCFFAWGRSSSIQRVVDRSVYQAMCAIASDRAKKLGG